MLKIILDFQIPASSRISTFLNLILKYEAADRNKHNHMHSDEDLWKDLPDLIQDD